MNFPLGSYGSAYWGAQGSSNPQFDAQSYQGSQSNNNIVTAYNWNTPYAIYDESFYNKYKGTSGSYAPAPHTRYAPEYTPAPSVVVANDATQNATLSQEVQKREQAYDALKEARDSDEITHEEYLTGFDEIFGTHIASSPKANPASPSSNTVANNTDNTGNANSNTSNSNANAATVADLQSKVTEQTQKATQLTQDLTQTKQALAQANEANQALTQQIQALAAEKNAGQTSSKITDFVNYAAVVPFQNLEKGQAQTTILSPDEKADNATLLDQTSTQLTAFLEKTASGAPDPEKRTQALATTAQQLSKNAPEHYAQFLENITPDMENLKKRVDALIAQNNTDKDFRQTNHASIDALRAQYNTLAQSFEKLPSKDKAPFAPITTTVLTGRSNHSITSPFGVSTMMFDQNLHNASQSIAFGLKTKSLYKTITLDGSLAGGLVAGIPYNISGYKLEGATVKPLKNVDNTYYVTPMLAASGSAYFNLGKGKIGADFEYKKQLGRTDELNAYLRYKVPSTFLNGFVKEVYYHHVRSRYLRQNDQEALTAESTQFGAQLVRHRYHAKFALGKGTLTVGYRNEFRDTPAPHGMQVVDILRDNKVSDTFLNRQSKRVELAYQVPVYHSGQLNILAGGRVRFDDNKRMADYDLDNGVIRTNADGQLLTKLKPAEQVAFVEPRIDIKFGSNASIYFFGRIAGTRKQGEDFNFNEAFSSLADSGTAAQTGFGATFNLGQKKRYDDFKLKF